MPGEEGTEPEKLWLQDLNGPLIGDLFFSSEGKLEAEGGEEAPSSETPNYNMTREELQAHLGRNEAEVKRMTEGVHSSLDKIGDKIDLRLSEIKAKNDSLKSDVEGDLKAVNKSIDDVEKQIGNLRWFIGIILTVGIITVGLLNLFSG